MAGGKVSPRQKMINMMYLVLIALLAMNVSAEILRAFHLMEVSFENTGKSLEAKMKASVAGIQLEVEKQGPKAVPYAERAKKAEKIVADLKKYLEGVSAEIVKTAGGRKELAEGQKNNGSKTEIANAGDTEGHANYFQSKKKKGKGHGEEVRKKIEDSRNALIALLKATPGDSTFKMSERDYNEIMNLSDLTTEGYTNEEGTKKSWEETILIEGPLASVVTNLARIKNEAVNMGNAVINKLQQGINATDIKIDRMVAMVNAPSSYVMSGTSYEADILLVAASSTANYEIMVNGAPLAVSGGVGKYKAPANGAGAHKVAGTIKLDDKTFTFDQEWTSFLPAATIAADAMNVLYLGLDNPISVSVPGVNPSNVTASMSGGSLVSKGAGKYIAKVTTGREAKISATAKMPDGSTRPMGGIDFRIKRVPDPTPKLGTQTSGNSSAGNLNIQNRVVVILDNFPFDGVKYSVNSCEIMVMHRNKAPDFVKCPGGIIPGGGLRVVTPGDKVIVGNIKVTGPGKNNELLSSNVVIDATK